MVDSGVTVRGVPYWEEYGDVNDEGMRDGWQVFRPKATRIWVVADMWGDGPNLTLPMNWLMVCCG